MSTAVSVRDSCPTVLALFESRWGKRSVPGPVAGIERLGALARVALAGALAEGLELLWESNRVSNLMGVEPSPFWTAGPLVGVFCLSCGWVFCFWISYSLPRFQK